MPTVAGTSQEVNASASWVDEEGQVVPLVDPMLMPQYTVIDASFLKMEEKDIIYNGMDMLVHGIESYASVAATEFTQPLSLIVIESVLKNLDKAAKGDNKALKEMLSASAMAGIAVANASLGVCHALAHALEVKYSVPHGVAVMMCLIPSMIFNACKAPQKMGVMPQYKYPCSDERYAQISEFCLICDSEMAM